MRKLFLEFRKKYHSNEDFSALDKIKSKTVSIAGTVQYLDFIHPVKKYLEGRGKKVFLKRGAFHEAHVIGCNPVAFNKGAETLLLLADGKFHAKNNALLLDREILVFNLRVLEKYSLDDLEKERRRIKAKKVKFLSSDCIGLIVSKKFGQENKAAERIYKKIINKGKKVYLFETDNISLSELENFPKIQVWVNTACYGLGLDDSRIINFQDILDLI